MSKGDILVSGRVEVVNDSLEVVGYQYQKADADIFADTQMHYKDTISTKYKKKYYEKSKRYQYYVKIGSWFVDLGTLKNNYKEWDLRTNEHQLKLGENFYLPISYGSKVIKSYTPKEKTYTKEEIQKQLTENFEQFSKRLQEKGIQIKENSVKIHIGQNEASATGELFLNERITQEADTEIIEIERNEQDESVRTDN